MKANKKNVLKNPLLLLVCGFAIGLILGVAITQGVTDPLPTPINQTSTTPAPRVGDATIIPQEVLSYSAPIIRENEWEESWLHFKFKYPKGWHVFSDGQKFTVDHRPIYYFPHQPFRVIDGQNFESNVQDEANTLLKNGFNNVMMPGNAEMRDNIDCYENRVKDVPEGPFPALDGQMVCFVTVPWGGSHSITYKLTGNDTNIRDNKAVFVSFIASIKPAE